MWTQGKCVCCLQFNPMRWYTRAQWKMNVKERISDWKETITNNHDSNLSPQLAIGVNIFYVIAWKLCVNHKTIHTHFYFAFECPFCMDLWIGHDSDLMIDWNRMNTLKWNVYFMISIGISHKNTPHLCIIA